MKKYVILLFLIIIVIPVFSKEKTRAEIVQALFKCVEDWFDSPYLYGGTSKDGVDCSGFVADVYKKVFYIKLPRSTVEQKGLGTLVEDKLQPGDLVFFNTTGEGISHVGVFVFGDKFIHAASQGTRTGVIKSSLSENYYKKTYVYARRIVKLPPYKKS